MKIKKAVIPAAGLGTRFLPITRSVPKEMLPVIDKPVISLIIEEIIASGIKEILIITSRGKASIEDYFDINPALDAALKKSNKTELLKQSAEINRLADIHYIRQKEANGLADAVMCAEKFTNGEPFALLLGDDLMYTPAGVKPCIKQLTDCFLETSLGTIALMETPDKDVDKYGNIKYTKQQGNKYFIENIVEKPAVSKKLSNFGVMGRYALPFEIFEIIKSVKPNPSGEVCFTDALLGLAKTKGLIGYKFEGIRYDTGDKLGYLKANIEYALRDNLYKNELREYLKSLVKGER